MGQEKKAFAPISLAKSRLSKLRLLILFPRTGICGVCAGISKYGVQLESRKAWADGQAAFAIAVGGCKKLGYDDDANGVVGLRWNSARALSNSSGSRKWAGR